MKVALVGTGFTPDARGATGVDPVGFANGAFTSPVATGDASGADMVQAFRHHCPQAEVLAIQLLDRRVTGATLAQVIDQALDAGCRIVAVPTGSPGFGGASELLAVSQKATEMGAVIVAIGVTSVRGETTRLLPGALEEVLGVVPFHHAPDVFWWADKATYRDHPHYSTVVDNFLVSGSYEGCAPRPAMTAVALMAGKLAKRWIEVPDLTPAALVSWARETALPMGERVAASPDAVPEHLRPLSDPLPTSLPFPELDKADLERNAWVALRWSTRLVQPLLAYGPAATAKAVRKRRQEAIEGNVGAWFDGTPASIRKLKHPHAKDVADVLVRLADDLMGGAPAPMSHYALRARRLFASSEEKTLQERDVQLDARLREHLVHDPRTTAFWLWEHHAGLPESIQDAAFARALDEATGHGTLPPTPKLPEACDPRMAQLMAWADALYAAQGTSAFTGTAMIVGNHMATQVPKATLLGKRTYIDLYALDDPRLANIPKSVLAGLDTYGPEIEQQWDDLDPIIHGWARQCLEAVAPTLGSAEVDRLLRSFDAGLGNAMIARWPSMSTAMEPVVVPWARAQEVLSAHLDSEPGATAWLAMHILVEGALHGDDSTRWIAQLQAITAHLTGVSASTLSAPIDALER